MQHSHLEKHRVSRRDLTKISAGKGSGQSNGAKGPLKEVQLPVYITLAIGEDGGKLPDTLS